MKPERSKPIESVLVTGATGAVGSAVVRTLLAKHLQVTAMSRSPRSNTGGPERWAQADLLDSSALSKATAGMDAVVHCAAALSDDLPTCLRANVEGVANLVEAMLAQGCRRLVHISTVSVYDYRVASHFVEDSPLWTEPVDAYGFTKAQGERVVRAAEAHGLEVVVLRPVAVLSMHPTSYWGPLALERARRSKDPVWPLAEFPFVDVDNLAQSVLLALETTAARGHVYNVMDGMAPTSEYLQAISTVLGIPAPSLSSAPRLTCSADRIRTELGYSAVNRWSEFLNALASAKVSSAV